LQEAVGPLWEDYITAAGFNRIMNILVFYVNPGKKSGERSLSISRSHIQNLTSSQILQTFKIVGRVSSSFYLIESRSSD
jgi:hypothetical protein